MYFKGFAITSDEGLFDEYTNCFDGAAIGFSMGAQRAFEHLYSASCPPKRLLLLSPAYFDDRDDSFMSGQVEICGANREAYLARFAKNAAYPSAQRPQIGECTQDELFSLLSYRWSSEKLASLSQRGIGMTAIFGAEDKIINVKNAVNFFKQHATTYTVKNVGHTLQR